LREMKRLENIARSPLYAHFSESLQGIVYIRSFDEEERFINTNIKYMDTVNRCTFYIFAANRWLNCRLVGLGAVIVIAVAIFSVVERNVLPAGVSALALSYAMGLTTYLNWLVRMLTDTEAYMNSVERVNYYATLPTEAPAEIEENRPSAGWPSAGCIVYEDVVMRYRPDLEPALRGISFRVEPREKIGIVGRTGSGKSSLMQTLFRLVELSAGSIYVDGVDISRLGLNDLRSVLSVIPQDPVMFSGSVRFNLDPTGTKDEDELWSSIASVGLSDFVKSLPEGLETDVAESGERFSVGQRQLVCLARALLRESRILIMDEATASVDVDTDALVQKMVRKSFKDCTVLTIAHRIDTVLDSDRILVMNDGQVAEFDTPAALLSQKSSMFYDLVNSKKT